MTASVANWTPGFADVAVLDNETTALALVVPATARERDSGLTGSVRISGTLGVPLTVVLASNDTSEITVPSSVTIPAGQVSTNFALTVVDDTLSDGAQVAQITATAAAFTSATANVTVADNDAHHFALAAIGASQIRNAPFVVTLTAQDVNNATITNYDSNVTL